MLTILCFVMKEKEEKRADNKHENNLAEVQARFRLVTSLFSLSATHTYIIHTRILHKAVTGSR